VSALAGRHQGAVQSAESLQGDVTALRIISGKCTHPLWSVKNVKRESPNSMLYTSAACWILFKHLRGSGIAFAASGTKKRDRMVETPSAADREAVEMSGYLRCTLRRGEVL
jgi:hypothetical protein